MRVYLEKRFLRERSSKFDRSTRYTNGRKRKRQNVYYYRTIFTSKIRTHSYPDDIYVIFLIAVSKNVMKIHYVFLLFNVHDENIIRQNYTRLSTVLFFIN